MHGLGQRNGRMPSSLTRANGSQLAGVGAFFWLDWFKRLESAMMSVLVGGISLGRPWTWLSLSGARQCTSVWLEERGGVSNPPSRLRYRGSNVNPRPTAMPPTSIHTAWSVGSAAKRFGTSRTEGVGRADRKAHQGDTGDQDDRGRDSIHGDLSEASYRMPVESGSSLPPLTVPVSPE